MNLYKTLSKAYIAMPNHLHQFNWLGEDYRGYWGWQLLADANGEGLMCGQDRDGTPYKYLTVHQPIASKYMETGFRADANSAPAIHVYQPVANWIKLTEPDSIGMLLIQMAKQDDLLQEVLADASVSTILKDKITNFMESIK